jgi:hypothetical protein
MVPVGIAASVVLAVSVGYFSMKQRTPVQVAQVTEQPTAQPAPPQPQTLSAAKRAKTVSTREPDTTELRKEKESDRAAAQPAPAAAQPVSETIATTGAAPLLDNAQQLAASSDGSAALQYTILKRSATGTFLPVAPNTMFEVGDQLRLALESNQAGTVQLLQTKDSGAPGPSFVGQLQRDQRVTIPANGAIRLDPGTSGTSLRLLFTSGAPPILQNSFTPGAALPQQRQMKAQTKQAAAEQSPSPSIITIDLNLNVKR